MVTRIAGWHDMLGEARKDYVLDSLERYWPGQKHLIRRLPLNDSGIPKRQGSTATAIPVELPDWAGDAGVDGVIIVPDWAVTGAAVWQDIDWVAVCFWYIHCCAEREHEKANGPVHSYSFKLSGYDELFWSRAWVNRIAIFLRHWVAHDEGRDHEDLFGVFPQARIHLTHDVDAIEKTLAIRFKQTAFHLFNAARSMLRLNFASATGMLYKAGRFLFSQDDYWCFDSMMEIEQSAGLRSTFNMYAGEPGFSRSPKQMLLDPAYDVASIRLSEQLIAMIDQGWQVGLHPSFDSWCDIARLRYEKQRLETAIGRQVVSSRQHWLRFGFDKTWQYLHEAGFEQDSTLGFNDRPAFRNSAAICYSPWDDEHGQAVEGFSVLPLILMDSHLYDYSQFSHDEMKKEMVYWIDEIKAVGGEATVLWHQRVISNDYGWRPGFEILVDLLSRK